MVKTKQALLPASVILKQREAFFIPIFRGQIVSFSEQSASNQEEKQQTWSTAILGTSERKSFSGNVSSVSLSILRFWKLQESKLF